MALRRLSAARSLACSSQRSSTSTSTSCFSTSTSSSSADKGEEASVHFDDGSGEKLAEVLDHALAKEKPKSSSSSSSSDPAATAAAVLTTRREALSLYRSIWRATALFTWSTDPKASPPPPLSPAGEPWREALRRSARREFEAGRLERDPVTVARMLVVGRDAVAQAVDKLAAKAAEVERGLRSGGGSEGERR